FSYVRDGLLLRLRRLRQIAFFSEKARQRPQCDAALERLWDGGDDVAEYRLGFSITSLLPQRVGEARQRSVDEAVAVSEEWSLYGQRRAEVPLGLLGSSQPSQRAPVSAAEPRGLGMAFPVDHAHHTQRLPL